MRRLLHGFELEVVLHRVLGIAGHRKVVGIDPQRPAPGALSRILCWREGRDLLQ